MQLTLKDRKHAVCLRIAKVWKLSVWLNSPWPFPLTAATRTSYVVLGSSPVSTTVAGEEPRLKQTEQTQELHLNCSNKQDRLRQEAASQHDPPSFNA